MRARLIILACLLVAVAVAVGRGGGSSDRAGGTRPSKTVVLTFAAHDSAVDAREWIAAVGRLSHGSLRIEVKSGWRPRQADYEKGTIGDVRAGKVDLGLVPARAYDRLGVRSFQGLLAPFGVDSYALERKVLAGALPDRMLSGVKPLGVTGIALLPGGLEKVLSISGPMLAPADYRERVIGIRPSAVATDTFGALGTSSDAFVIGGDDSSLDGIALDLSSIVASRLQFATAGESLPANVSFWPRAITIVMSEKTSESLTQVQRDILRTAAPAALVPAMRRIERDEHDAVKAICQQLTDKRASLYLLSATPSNLGELHTAVQPVYRKLASDPTTRAVIAAIERIKGRATAEPSPRCKRDPVPRVRAKAALAALHLSGELTATRSTWVGAVASRQLGQGRLELKHRLAIKKDKLRRRPVNFEARFAGGMLRGCMNLTVSPEARGVLSWDGPGTIKQASPALRRFVGLSVRFAGITRASDLTHVRGGFSTAAPVGIPCAEGSGI